MECQLFVVLRPNACLAVFATMAKSRLMTCATLASSVSQDVATTKNAPISGTVFNLAKRTRTARPTAVHSATALPAASAKVGRRTTITAMKGLSVKAKRASTISAHLKNQSCSQR